MKNTKALTALCKLLFPSMEVAYEQYHPMHLITALADEERLVTITASPGWHFRGWYVSICIASPDGPHKVFQYEEADIESCFYKHVEANRTDALEKMKSMEGIPDFTLPEVIAEQYRARINQINPFKFTPLSK